MIWHLTISLLSVACSNHVQIAISLSFYWFNFSLTSSFCITSKFKTLSLLLLSLFLILFVVFCFYAVTMFFFLTRLIYFQQNTFEKRRNTFNDTIKLWLHERLSA